MLIEFCQVLLAPSFDVQKWPAEFIQELPDMTRKGLGRLDEFRQLCRHVQTPTLLPDLFHLWTGEVNGCEFFLTMEKTLPNFCASHVHRPLVCRPIDPTGLLHELGVRELDPAFAKVGEYAGFFEARRLDDQK
jgi:hypothetical protein